MAQKSWFAKKSFPIIVFLCPLTVLYMGFLAVMPKEVLNTKPSLDQFIIGILGAITGWVLLVVVFSFIWVLLMRMLYGSTQVRKWLYEDKPDLERMGNSLESLMRKICELAL